jgi:hypothetical protein
LPLLSSDHGLESLAVVAAVAEAVGTATEKTTVSYFRPEREAI